MNGKSAKDFACHHPGCLARVGEPCWEYHRGKRRKNRNGFHDSRVAKMRKVHGRDSITSVVSSKFEQGKKR